MPSFSQSQAAYFMLKVYIMCIIYPCSNMWDADVLREDGNVIKFCSWSVPFHNFSWIVICQPHILFPYFKVCKLDVTIYENQKNQVKLLLYFGAHYHWFVKLHLLLCVVNHVNWNKMYSCCSSSIFKTNVSTILSYFRFVIISTNECTKYIFLRKTMKLLNHNTTTLIKCDRIIPTLCSLHCRSLWV